MPDRTQHCPFLNRSDARCAAHFSLGGLTDAFEQCFDRYAACGVYRQLLAERRLRRGEPAGLEPAWADPHAEPYHGCPTVPLTVAAGRSDPGGPAIPAA